MRSLAPSRALARRSRQLLTLALVIGALGAFVVAIGFLLLMIPLVAAGSPNFGGYHFIRMALIVLGFLLFLLAIGLAVRAVTLRTDNDLALRVGHYLETHLDDRFTLIRNVSQRALGYIDAVLVGPPGALVFRLVDVKGAFTNERANWVRFNRRQEPIPWGINPTRECVADIQKVREHLGRLNLGEVPVYGVIVFMQEPPALQLSTVEPVVPITYLSGLLANLQGHYLAKERIDAPRVAATVRTLLPT